MKSTFVIIKTAWCANCALYAVICSLQGSSLLVVKAKLVLCSPQVFIYQIIDKMSE